MGRKQSSNRRRGASLVEVLVVLAVFVLGSITAMRTVQRKVSAAADHTGEQVIAMLAPNSRAVDDSELDAPSRDYAATGIVYVSATAAPTRAGVQNISVPLGAPANVRRGPLRAPRDPGKDIADIREKLKGNFFGDVSNGTLHEITRELAKMTPEERRAVIAGLSDDELREWMDEVGGAWGGLNGDEKRELYGLLAEGGDGAQLARVARAVFDKVPESEQEFIDSVVARASPTTKAQFAEAMAADVSAEPNGFDVQFGSTVATRDYGNAPARAVVATLGSLARDPAAQADFDRAILGVARAGKLDDVMRAANGRVDSTGAPLNGGGLGGSSFKPKPLLEIIDGAARSSDPEVRRQVLLASAPALSDVEFTDETYQKAGIIKRPETAQIASALNGLLGVPKPKPEWTPPSSLNGESDYSESSATDLERLRSQKARVDDAADYYDIDPRAIAVVTDVEAKFNNSLVRKVGLGRGEGYGSMHDSAVKTIHPEWSDEQASAARNNAAYAPALIAADMDAKARAFELVTGGAISIRNDPVALAWAYNSSLAAVTKEAERARAALDQGQPVVLDMKSADLGDYGMAGHAKRELEEDAVDDFASENPPSSSPTPYRGETL